MHSGVRLSFWVSCSVWMAGSVTWLRTEAGEGDGSGNNMRNKMRHGEQRAGFSLGLATRLTWDLVELVPV